MKKLAFSLYGFLIGALFAVFGGMLFAIIPVTVMLYGMLTSDIGQFFVIYGFAGLFSVGFAFIPGAVGGAYLARWLEKSERAPHDVTRHSLLVGALAGLAASLAFIVFILDFNADWTVFGFAILAIAVASGASLLTARFLAKKKEKFVTSHPLP